MRARILLAMVAVTTLAVTLFAVPLGLSNADRIRNDELRTLQQQATSLLQSLPAAGIDSGDPIRLPPLAADVVAGVYDRDGRRIAGSGPAQADTATQTAIAGQIGDADEDDTLVVAVPVFDEVDVVGAVRVSESLSEVDGVAQDRWTALVLAGLTAVALSAVLAAALSRRLAQPIRGLVDVAVRMGDGDLSGRVPASGVAEVDHAGDALNRTAERLEHLIARERAFTADVSHQLSTPLASLRLGLEESLLVQDTPMDVVVGRAIDEVDRLGETVATLLGARRDDLPTAAACDPVAVADSVVSRRRPMIVRAGRTVSVEADPSVPPVRCPAPVLSEILSILVDNALAHGGGAILVSVRGRGDGATISVSDEGPGVSPERVDRIFRRGDPSAAGRGIGLSLARSLADASGLRLELTRAAPAPVFTVACPGVVP